MRTDVAQDAIHLEDAAPRHVPDAERVAVGAQHVSGDLLIFLKRTRRGLSKMCGMS
jgi:hypothetical protein